MTGFLDGLRAIAAFSVLICHCMIWSAWPGLGLPILPSPGTLSKLAVDLFMIISGFLMAYNAYVREDKEPIRNPGTWLIFYIRRYFRIAPAYYLSLAAAVLLSDHFLSGYALLADRIDGIRDSYYNARNIHYSLENLLLHGTFAFGLLPAASFSTQLPDWSLSLEMQFYAVFPFLMLALRRVNVLAVVSVSVLLGIAASKFFPTFREPSFLLFKLPIFLAGVLLCRAMMARGESEHLLLGTLAVGMSFTQYRYYGLGVVWIAFSVFLVVILISDKVDDLRSLRRWLLTVLDNRIAHAGSELSYSVYLFHGFFIAIVGSALFRNQLFVTLNPHARTLLFLLGVTIPTVLVAVFVRRFVEQPGIAMGKILINLVRVRQPVWHGVRGETVVPERSVVNGTGVPNA